MMTLPLDGLALGKLFAFIDQGGACYHFKPGESYERRLGLR